MGSRGKGFRSLTVLLEETSTVPVEALFNTTRP
jgi:hypothetical protein